MKHLFLIPTLLLYLCISCFSQDLSTGLVGHWPFCGNADDVSGNGNHGTVNGATLTTDRNGNSDNAYNFLRSTSDNVEIDPNSSFDDIENNNEVTICAWVFPTNNSIFQWPIVNKYNQNNDEGWEVMLEDYLGKIVFFGRCGNYINIDYDFNINEWYHVAITYDQTNSLITYYVNGQEIGSRSYNTTLVDTQNGPFYIGASPMCPNEYSQGKIDDVWLFSRALTGDEISAIYQSSSYSQGELTSSVSFIDFGRLFCSTDSTISLTLTNVGSEASNITGTKLKGGANSAYAVSNGGSFSLDPGSSRELSLKFAPSKAGLFKDTLVIENSDCAEPLKIVLYGQKDKIEYSFNNNTYDSIAVNFGIVCPNSTKDTTLTIKNTSSVDPVQLISSGIGSPFAMNGSSPFSTPFNKYDTRTLGIKFAGVPDTGQYKQLLTITDPCGKEKKLLLLATVRRPYISLCEDTIICFKADYKLKQRTTGGTPPFKYSWVPLDLLNDSALPEPMIQKLTNKTKFICTVTDQTGCVDKDSVTIDVHPALTVEAGEYPTICHGNKIQLSCTVDGFYEPFIYQWFPAKYLDNPKIKDPTAILDTTTEFIIWVTNAEGCTATDTVKITVNPEIVVDAGKDIITVQDSSVKIISTASGGLKPYYFIWKPQEGLSDPYASNPAITLRKPGIYKYILTVRDSLLCMGSDTLTVEVKIGDKIIPSIEGNSSVCENTIETYKAFEHPDLSYQWFVGGGEIIGESNGPEVIIKWIGFPEGYVKLIQTMIGKNYTDSVTQKVKIFPQPPKPVITEVEGMLISSIKSGNQWFIEGKPIEGAKGNELQPEETGNYMVQVTDENGCVSEQSDAFYFEITSVNNYSIINKLDIYPNPTDDNIIIDAEFDQECHIEIRLVNILGNELIKLNRMDRQKLIEQINTEGLVPGLYFIEFRFGKEVLLRKVIKK